MVAAIPFDLLIFGSGSDEVRGGADTIRLGDDDDDDDDAVILGWFRSISLSVSRRFLKDAVIETERVQSC